MRRILFLFIMLVGLCASVSAQTYHYKTTSFAYKYVNEYGRWTQWSDWMESNLLLTIDFDDDVIKVFTEKTQVYLVTKFVGNYTDSSGGQQAEFRVVDQDGDAGSVRLRIEKNGNSQVYIEFSNIMWVYNVKKI